MATRTVRDCDRCGKQDIQVGQISRFLSSGTRVDFDLCVDCRAMLFPFVLGFLGDMAVISLRDEAKRYRDSTTKQHGATPHDMRP